MRKQDLVAHKLFEEHTYDTATKNGKMVFECTVCGEEQVFDKYNPYYATTTTASGSMLTEDKLNSAVSALNWNYDET